ncbi:hypothetical protein [Allorhizocola rhizosphaerae]|uniref:hypothetical protein n=1 Tax=Allorhizocola rhizosphaerae TaxID=1872709 RepID=UPI001B8B211C|nr:hypothetical protein [Allorhizocola rhizosphaerae]
MTFTWTLSGHGWADCLVADDQTQAEATASYITLAPNDLLEAVTRIVAMPGETRAQFEAEPTIFRWIFFREGDHVWIQMLQMPDRQRHDKAGIQLWSSWQTVDTLARAIIRGFDTVASERGESRYQDKWGHPFPRTELEKLRAVWRQYQSGGSSEG